MNPHPLPPVGSGCDERLPDRCHGVHVAGKASSDALYNTVVLARLSQLGMRVVLNLLNSIKPM